MKELGAETSKQSQSMQPTKPPPKTDLVQRTFTNLVLPEKLREIDEGHRHYKDFCCFCRDSILCLEAPTFKENHALPSFFPAWLLVYTAAFVRMLDSVFLVSYSWFRYYGLLMIAAVTDRFFIVRIMMQWLSDEDAKGARSSEGQNHDRHASQQCRKWTDSAAARCSNGKNHDTTVLSPISSDLLDCMCNKLPLLMGLFMMFYPDQCSIFTTNIIFVTVILSILLIGISKISRLEKELSRLKSKQSEIDSLRAKVEILEKNPTQNIFGPGSKQVNVVVETEGSSEKITSSLEARSVSEALVGISDQQSLNKPQLYNKNFGIDREEYEKIPVLTCDEVSKCSADTFETKSQMY